MFYLWVSSVAYKVFFYFVALIIIVFETVVISDRWTILEIGKDLKTKTFPSIVKFLIRDSHRMLFTT